MNYSRARYINRIERRSLSRRTKENEFGKDRNRADERVAEIISGKHEEGRAEGRGQEAAWGVL